MEVIINMIGEITTTTFDSQTKGNLSNLGLFGNIGINFNQNQFLSIHTRNDDHKETGGNKTYKVSFSNQYEKFLINLSTSTGIRNPSLYDCMDLLAHIMETQK